MNDFITTREKRFKKFTLHHKSVEIHFFFIITIKNKQKMYKIFDRMSLTILFAKLFEI
jgi:putative SOS response-associated peptidase YedK